ncbi:hypothetical protein [Noviherbaspirillum malthae]|jgi:Ca2+/Na+ antiporter|uniref:hypothetical protein n=1 Tax=Noviherbaspirillum malthae TaxID=1260987 RepID=UPI00188F6578|nr:hypothetical protein [Noviherbaspirillum malthae]
MKLIMKGIAHVLFVLGLGIFYILPRNKYDWMQTIDPATASLPVDQSADTRLIFTATVLLVMVLAQGLLIVKTSKKNEKMMSLLLIFIAVTIWYLKYL